MTRTTLRHGLILLTAGIGASLGHIAPAKAGTPVFPAVVKLQAGIGGELQKNGGAGAEMIYSAVFNDKGSQYVVSIFMSSNVKQGDNEKYWQCKCSSILMDPILGPRIVVDQKQITDNGGERSCNHPRIASGGANYGVWTYGSNDVNGNTRTWAQGITNMCEVMGDRVRISDDDNQNEGAPHVVYSGANDYYIGGYLSTANNDLDASYAWAVKANMTDGVQKMWLTNVVNPSNIGRPDIVPLGTDKVFFVATQGNNRPEEVGVVGATVDVMTGKVIHKELIAASDPANSSYMMSPTVARITDNTIAIQWLESNGNGKKTNIKGSSMSHLAAYTVSDTSFTKQAYANGVGLAPTHSSICSGTYGIKGEQHIAVFGMSPTGAGQPTMQFATFEGASFKADVAKDNWVVGYYGDSGRLSNLYGPNPNQQGRDFPMCIGGVPNPGFGRSNGYMSTVKTFFLAPHAGNNGTKEELKNGAYLTFVPAEISEAVTPTQPDSPKKGIGVPGLDDGTGKSTGDITDNPPGDGTEVHVSGPGLAGCSVPAPGSKSPAELAFLALGVGALFAARRRR